VFWEIKTVALTTWMYRRKTRSDGGVLSSYA
jgi:hypothetical protein